MTNIQKLGQAIKFYREQRKLSRARVADMTKSTVQKVEAWEEGLEIPNSREWELLKKLMHRGLVNMTAVRAQAFVDRETGELMHRPFEALRPKPISNEKAGNILDAPRVIYLETELKVSQTQATSQPQAILQAQEPIMDNPKTDKLAAARAVLQNCADKDWCTAERITQRHNYARKLLETTPEMTNEKVLAEVRAKFNGVGVKASGLARIREDVRQRRSSGLAVGAADLPSSTELKSEPKLDDLKVSEAVFETSDENMFDFARDLYRKSPSIKDDGPGGVNTLMMRKFNLTLTPAKLAELRNEVKVDRAAARTLPQVNAGDIEAVARLVLDVIPNLKTFSIEIDDNGEMNIDHTVRKIITASGSLKVKVKQ